MNKCWLIWFVGMWLVGYMNNFLYQFYFQPNKLYWQFFVFLLVTYLVACIGIWFGDKWQ